MNRRSFLTMISGSGGYCLSPTIITHPNCDVCIGARGALILTCAEADSVAAIASLQHRLTKLKTGARIVVR